jgi:hypothetical protein
VDTHPPSRPPLRVYAAAHGVCRFTRAVTEAVFGGQPGFVVTNSMSDTCQVVVYSHYETPPETGPETVRVFLDGESGTPYSAERDAPLSDADRATVYVGPTANHAALRARGVICLFAPFVSLSFGERSAATPLDLALVRPPSDWHERRFCADMYSNPVPFRESFFDSLCAEASGRGLVVDALGACSGSRTVSIRKSTRANANYLDEAVALYRKYQYVIAFENEAVSGYVTEKIASAYLAGCIPVYSGTTTVFDIFEPASMIFVDPTHPVTVSARAVIEEAMGASADRRQRCRSVLTPQALTTYFSWHPSVPGQRLGAELRSTVFAAWLRNTRA